jgi:type IV pilus assembly protein PilM
LKSPLVYHKGPLLGIDIGSHAAKIVQVRHSGRGVDVVGYGHVSFAPETVVEGIIVDPEGLAQVIQPVLAGSTGAKFTARRVASALPISRVFTRTMQLPTMEPKDLDDAIRTEAEQSIPVPPSDLYIDHEIIGTSKTDKGETRTDVMMAAAPRAIADSYVKLFKSLNLDLSLLEVSLMSDTRAISAASKSLGPALVVDFGSASADLAVYDGVIRFTGTIAVGGDQITATLVKNLGITAEQANEIKYKFGIGPSGLQAKVLEALDPLLKSLVNEIKKAIKYYQDRAAGKVTINQVIATGGSSNMPGLLDYLTKALGVPATLANPWTNLGLKHVKPVDALEAPLYTTAIGLALLEVTK